MLTVRPMTPADAVALLLDTPPGGGMTAPEWEAIRKRHGLLAFTAAEGTVRTGFALAQSHPALVHVVHLEGSAEACRRLLGRLARAADRRPVSVWCPHPGDVLVHEATFSLEEAEQYIRAISAPFGPHSEAQWRFLTENWVRKGDDGKWRPHYDPRIVEANRAPYAVRPRTPAHPTELPAPNATDFHRSP